ncbi:uncharacterized protein BT62DRAFT_925961 [Guyanagaster necrorhizus]|uniref:Hydrophobin n=1 Tax=Guyanagaster necrorhizus TaxID=856835 RepID=A0A9P7W415_9AGAR|nr:uncharacterized protein BT62DRAFT_925961 [Guyanagaster necrorhizus MCA 3950]KAG7451778.1 hypothetical protein BT62DRAFT_925961 [Guyanagaster necrorhizus MCA 3950]
MWKQALTLLHLYFIFCVAAPGPKVNSPETTATCAPPAQIWCCSELNFVSYSYVGTGCEPFRDCLTPVCCTGKYYNWCHGWWLRIRVAIGNGKFIDLSHALYVNCISQILSRITYHCSVLNAK